jgi:predicted O-methyltransferase YrrM
MSTRINVAIDENMETYLDAYASLEHPALRACRDEANTRGDMAVMQIAPEQGALFGLLVKITGARRVLELGAFTGYSAAAFALALPDDGKVVTCDVTDEYLVTANAVWSAAGVQSKIEFVKSDALVLLHELASQETVFDIVLIDADKPNYPAYYEASLALVRPGGLILIDDTLARGFVVNDPDPAYGQYILDSVEAIRVLNRKVHADASVEMALIPAWDGMTIVRKR